MDMDRESIAGKIICITLFIFFCLFLVGCSHGKNYFLFWKQGETEHESYKSKVSVFVSNIRTPLGNPDSHYLLACYYQERGRHKEAIEEFNKVIVIDPLHVKAHIGLGISYGELKDYSKSISTYLIALKLNPKLDYAYNNIGYSYLLQGNINAAIEALRKASDLNRGSSRIHNNLGIAYLMKGDAQRAREEFEIGSGKAQAFYNVARLYFQNNMFYEARETFTRALDMNPSLGEAQKGLEASDTLFRISQALSKQTEDVKDFVIVEESAYAARNTNSKPAAVEIQGSLTYQLENVKQVDSIERKQNIDIKLLNGANGVHVAKSKMIAQEKRVFDVDEKYPISEIGSTTDHKIQPKGCDVKAVDQDIYVIKKGEHLVKILRKVYGLTHDQIYHQYIVDIKKLNPDIKNVNLIYPGQKIRIPLPLVAVASLQRKLTITPCK